MNKERINVSADFRNEKFWTFVRGDLPVKDFEEWVYSEKELEKVLGEKLYLDVISANYSDNTSIFEIKQQLTEFLRDTHPQKCKCIELPQVAVVDMGEDSKEVFKHFEEIKKRGDPYWWLSVDSCKACGQIWLVASEERQNDVYCLHRLTKHSLQEILENNNWPSCFDRYETLLRIGLEAGVSVTFVDPLESSLTWTVVDLVKDRPGITVSEIAELLNIDCELAKELASKAIKEEKVEIKLK